MQTCIGQFAEKGGHLMAHKLAEKLASVKSGTLFAGIDLALERNMAVLITERAAVQAQFYFPNDRLGYDYLLRRLRVSQERAQAPAVLVGMEPTNYFWKLLAAELEQQAVPYRLVNPYTVKKHREGDNLDRSKDDPRDAFTIADLLRTGKFTESQLLHGPYADLRQYAQHYDRLQQELRRHKNLLVTFTGQLFRSASKLGLLSWPRWRRTSPAPGWRGPSCSGRISWPRPRWA
jgi:hypothetical protein